MQDVFGPATAFFDSQLKNLPMGFLPPYLVGNDYLVEELEQFELLEGPPQTTIPIGENSEAEPLPAQSLQQGTDGGVERPGAEDGSGALEQQLTTKIAAQTSASLWGQEASRTMRDIVAPVEGGKSLGQDPHRDSPGNPLRALAPLGGGVGGRGV